MYGKELIVGLPFVNINKTNKYQSKKHNLAENSKHKKHKLKPKINYKFQFLKNSFDQTHTNINQKSMYG